jgi:hypothetical protein
LAALCGIAVGGASIAVATLVAATGRSLRSPLVDFGDRFIEITPAWLTNLAISLFGTNDKTALSDRIGDSVITSTAQAGGFTQR